MSEFKKWEVVKTNSCDEYAYGLYIQEVGGEHVFSYYDEDNELAIQIVTDHNEVERLRAENEELIEYKEYSQDVHEVSMKDCVSLQAKIDELKKQLTWIPVSERLPEEGKCLVSFNWGKDIDNETDVLLMIYENDEFMVYTDECVFPANDCGNVTHWLPLPEDKQ